MHSYIKKGLGGSQSYDPLKMIKYISMVATMKRQYMFRTTAEEDFLRSLKEFLVVHPDP
jgi:hypothetical protein